MKIACIYSGVVQGVTTISIAIEAHMSSGIPQIHIVGLADQTIRESKDRLLVAFQYAQIKLPNKKFVLSLNPTDLKKQGGHLDLPMALALLRACGHLPESSLKIGALGAVTLAGQVTETNQVFALIDSLVTEGCDFIFIPSSCGYASKYFSQAVLVPVSSLAEVVWLLGSNDQTVLERLKSRLNTESEDFEDIDCNEEGEPHLTGLDFDQVRGQSLAKRALMLAIGGRHHLLLYGPPGTGKTMLASRIPGVLPPLEGIHVYERLKRLSCAGAVLPPHGRTMSAPFRSPHSGTSLSAMLGGMQAHMLGEAALAHRGILFLDEMPEYKRDVLEGLRGPLESGEIHLSKTHYKALIPADFTLVATANPCPCGYFGFSEKCSCTDRDRQRYFSKLSGPILDRFDMKVEVSFKPEEDSGKSSQSLNSEEMKKLILKVRALQKERYGGSERFNGQLGPKGVSQWCILTESGEKWVEMNLQTKSAGDSLRQHFKIIKLARTIADFDGSALIDRRHLIEAFYYNRRKLI